MKLLLALVLMCSLNVGCPVPNPPTTAIIDCTIQNKDQLGALVAEFRVILTGQAPDWSAVYQRAKNAGKAIGGCALATVVQEYLGNRTAPPAQADGWNANNALERFRREEAGNATFRTAAGDL